MGQLMWGELARLVALAACTYLVWSNAWGIAYRKFGLDAVGGHLGPRGIVAPPSSALFVSITVRRPIVQVANILIGLVGIAVEYPLSSLRSSRLRTTLWLPAAYATVAAFPALLVYQSTDAAVYLLIASALYWRAHRVGESRPDAAGPAVRTGSDSV